MLSFILALVVGLIVLGSSVWVLIDAQRLALRAGRGGDRGLLSNDPATWFLGCVLLWIMVFPMYLVARTKMGSVRRSALLPEASAGSDESVAAVAMGPAPGSIGAPEWVGATALGLGIVSIPAAVVGVLGAPLWLAALALGAWGAVAGGPGRRLAVGGFVAGLVGFFAMLAAIVTMAMWMRARHP